MSGARRQDAEDAVQLALERCCRSWRRAGRIAENPEAYALIVTRRILGKQSARPGLRHLHEATSAPLADIEGRDAIWDALRRLPHAQREVVVYAFYLDLTDAALAEVLGIPLGTAKSRKSRALAALAADETLDQTFSTHKEPQ